LRLTSSTNGAGSPDLYFGPNHSANNYWGARIATPLDLGSSQRFLSLARRTHGVGPYGLDGTDCQFAGSISGAGGMTIIAQNNWTALTLWKWRSLLNASNSFTGPLEIQRGSIYQQR